MRLAAEAAGRRQPELPLLNSVRAGFEQGVERYGDEDMSATYRSLSRPTD